MNSSVEELDGNKVKVSVSVDESEFDKDIDAAFKRIAQEVNLPGFRRGKAPRRILEARLGAGVAREEALREALPKYYADAVTEHDVDVIAAPELEITGGQEDGPVDFEAVVEVRPVVTVPGYDGLRITMPSPEPSDEEIQNQIDRMRNLDATVEVVERAAEEGDTVVIDIVGTLDGEEQDGLTTDDYSYEVGSGIITPEVDEHLAGASAGDELSFDATHPDEDEERQLHFDITVKEVKAKVLPELTDEWAVGELRLRDRRGARERPAHPHGRGPQGPGRRRAAGEGGPGARQAGRPRAARGAREHGAQQPAPGPGHAPAGPGPPARAVPDDDRPHPGAARRRAARGGRDLVPRRPRPPGRGRRREASTAPTTTSTPRSNRSPSGSARSRPRCAEQLERNDQIPAVRSDITKRKALEWLLDHVEIVDENGAPVDRSLYETDHDHDHDHDDEEDDDG